MHIYTNIGYHAHARARAHVLTAVIYIHTYTVHIYRWYMHTCRHVNNTPLFFALKTKQVQFIFSGNATTAKIDVILGTLCKMYNNNV